jgi:3-oxoacyl-[acyl-carrier protein] reductase
MARFTDRNVIVTGGAQGIGRGIVEAFLAEGARVFAADLLMGVYGDALELARLVR